MATVNSMEKESETSEMATAKSMEKESESSEPLELWVAAFCVLPGYTYPCWRGLL